MQMWIIGPKVQPALATITSGRADVDGTHGPDESDEPAQQSLAEDDIDHEYDPPVRMPAPEGNDGGDWIGDDQKQQADKVG